MAGRNNDGRISSKQKGGRALKAQHDAGSLLKMVRHQVRGIVCEGRARTSCQGDDGSHVDFERMAFLKNTRFTEFLVQKNALDRGGFKGWIFCPGMRFNSTDNWWGDQGKRNTLHEGLDLCFFKDGEGTILRLGEKTKVPVLYDGRVVGIIDDFLGKSVIVEHKIPNGRDRRLCTIYGHTIPEDNLHVGGIVRQGDVIATLAGERLLKTKILSHLHISLGWTSRKTAYDRLDWKNIGAPNRLSLLDPLPFIDGSYLVSEREKCVKSGCAAKL